MQVTTIEEARALVGRTFERDGERVQFIGIKCMPGYTDMLTLEGKVERWVCWEYYAEWLKGATEVPQ